MAQGSRRLVSSSLKIKNDSQIRYRFLFLPIFFFPIAGLGQKLFWTLIGWIVSFGEQVSKVHHIVKEAEEQRWPWEIKHPVPFEKQPDQNIVQIQDDH